MFDDALPFPFLRYLRLSQRQYIRDQDRLKHAQIYCLARAIGFGLVDEMVVRFVDVLQAVWMRQATQLSTLRLINVTVQQADLAVERIKRREDKRRKLAKAQEIPFHPLTAQELEEARENLLLWEQYTSLNKDIAAWFLQDGDLAGACFRDEQRAGRPFKPCTSSFSGILIDVALHRMFGFEDVEIDTVLAFIQEPVSEQIIARIEKAILELQNAIDYILAMSFFILASLRDNPQCAPYRPLLNRGQFFLIGCVAAIEMLLMRDNRNALGAIQLIQRQFSGDIKQVRCLALALCKLNQYHIVQVPQFKLRVEDDQLVSFLCVENTVDEEEREAEALIIHPATSNFDYLNRYRAPMRVVQVSPAERAVFQALWQPVAVVPRTELPALCKAGSKKQANLVVDRPILAFLDELLLQWGISLTERLLPDVALASPSRARPLCRSVSVAKETATAESSPTRGSQVIYSESRLRFADRQLRRNSLFSDNKRAAKEDFKRGLSLG